jgi:hypothetical protein
MDSTEIAELFCKVLCGESSPANLESFIDEEAIWTLLPVGTSGSASLAHASGIDFLGRSGIVGLMNFLQGTLNILSGEMTGCIAKGDITFVFGKITLETLVNSTVIATNFSAQLSFRTSRILICRLKLLWPLFDPGIAC